MNEKKKDLELILDLILKRKALIVTNIKSLGDLVSLHSQHLGIGCDGKYWKSVKHLGFGCFRGHTHNGYFEFSGGGAMITKRYKDKTWFAYSRLITENDRVLKDLDYPFDKVELALRKEISNL